MRKTEAILTAMYRLLDREAQGAFRLSPELHTQREEARKYFRSKEGRALFRELEEGAGTFERMLVFEGPRGMKLGLDLNMTLEDLGLLGLRISIKKGVQNDTNSYQ